MITVLLNQFCRPTKSSKKSLLTFKNLLFLIMFSIYGLSVNAQVANYSYTGVSVASGGPAYPANIVGTALFGSTTWDDNVATAIPVGFTFTFNGSPYTTVNVSSNGFITFGATAPLATNYTPISSAATYAGAISAYGVDLSSNGASLDCRYITTGVSPNRIFTVEYQSVKRKLSGVVQAGTWNFRINLYETTNVVQIQYKVPAVAFAATPVATPVLGQIGLRGSTNSDYNNRSWPAPTPGNWPTASPIHNAGTANTDAVLTRGIATLTSATTMTWTPAPCTAPSSISVTTGSVTSSGATITWPASLPAPTTYGYQYYYTTSAVLPTGGTVPSAPDTFALTAAITGLNPSTLYYVYIRKKCDDGSVSGWSSAATFTTQCNPAPDPFLGTPYSQNFNASSPPTLPTCASGQNTGAGLAHPWITEAPTIPNWGFGDNHLSCASDGSNDTSAYYFTQGVTLTGGQSYRLSYKYGAYFALAYPEQSMEVYYGTSPLDSSMSNFLADHPVIKGGPFNNVINFIPVSSGVYYFGFHDYTAAGNDHTLLDDIKIEVTTCLQPTGLISGLITSNSALISWVAPSPAPANGYDYYINTTGISPNNGTVPTGSTSAGVIIANLSLLTSNTTYYYWIRSNCGSGDFSGWSVSGNFHTAVTPVTTYCTPAGTGFQDPFGITNVTMGTINNSTGLEAGNYGNYSALSTTIAIGAILPVSITYQTGFTYDTTIFVDWNNDGDFADAGESVVTGNSTNTIPSTLTLNFTIPAGAILGTHRLRIGGQDFGPVTDPCRVGTYQAFEDYSIYVIPTPPPLTLSASSVTICSGVPSVPITTITAGLAYYDIYVWSPSTNVSGTPASGYSFNPSSTTVYTLTVIKSSNFDTNTVRITVNVNQPPTPIVITPSISTVCQGQVPQTLLASGGIVSGATILAEGFNAITPPVGWVTTNTSTLGVPANADWKLRNSPFTPGGTWGQTISSNDASQFYFCDSDSQGSGSVTATTLTTPSFSLVGFTTASLSFWHYYRAFTNSSGTVQISTTSPTSGFTTLPSQTYTTTQGTQAGFVNVTVDLAAYLGQSNVYIRFKYDGTWGYGWAIDNFLVSGSTTSSITWLPVTGLYTSYTSSTVNTPYVSGVGASTVYALPNATTTYTASATSGLGCSASTTATVNVTPLVPGVITGGNQYICENTPASALTLTGYIGTIVRWEWSLSPTFASGINTISNILPTLSSGQIGLLTATTYFRAVVTTGGCANSTSNIAAIYIPTTTWQSPGVWSNGTPDSSVKAIFNYNFTSTLAGIQACAVEVISGNVVFIANSTLEIDNKLTVTGGTLTFNNTASLVQYNNVANSGSITYIRNTTPVRPLDYTYWSSPMELQEIHAFTNSTKYFYWDTTSYYNWRQIPSTPPYTMNQGQGYIIRSPIGTPAGTTIMPLSFYGVPTNGTITTPIVVNGANNLNLIGNPYPSAIDADYFLSTTGPNNGLINGAIYLWTHNTPMSGNAYTSNDYATYTLLGGVGTLPAPSGGVTPNGKIAAGQGFFVEGIVNGSVATFQNYMRIVGSNNQFFKTSTPHPAPIEKHRLWLDLSDQNGNFKQTLIGYIDGATSGKDNAFDGNYADGGTLINFYSLLANDRLAVKANGLPFNDQDLHLLGYNTTVAGTFEIQLSNFDGLFANQNIYLEDKLLNIVYDLKQSPYSFTTEIGTFEDRFVLRFTDSTLAANVNSFSNTNVIIFKNTSGIHVQSLQEKIKDITVFDTRGRTIYSNKSVNSKDFTISNLNASQQVLIVQTTSIEGVIVSKKIVF